MSSSFPPDPSNQPPAPGEVPRASAGGSWKWIAGLAVVAVAMLIVRAPEFRNLFEEFSAGLTQPQPAPQTTGKPPVRAPVAKAPASKPLPAPPVVQEPVDDRARPVSFYFARWGVTEVQSPIGWTSRIDIRQGQGNSILAKVWITCPRGICEAGEYPITPVAHLQKRDMTAFLTMERRDGDRLWTFLLRPAPGRPDELERWEQYGPWPPRADTRTQSVLGHVRRMKADGVTFY